MMGKILLFLIQGNARPAQASLGNLKSGELENSIGQQLARMRYLKLSQSKLLTSQLEDPEVEELNYYSMEASLGSNLCYSNKRNRQ